MGRTNQPLEQLDPPVLGARIAHLAHDLDKTINTLAGDAGFEAAYKAERDSLEKAMAEWRRRELPVTESMVWGEGLLREAAGLLGRQGHGTAGPPKSRSGSDLMEAILSRRSVRRWTPGTVDESLIEQVLVAARWAPSACNRQSCRYLVLQEERRRAALARVREPWLARAPVLILVGADGRNYHPEEVDLVPYMDAAMAVQNLLLAAHGAGLGGVVVKATNRDIRAAASLTHVQAVRECWDLLCVPCHFIPVAVVGLGWPARMPAPPPRLPREQVVSWEAFPPEESLRATTRPGPRWVVKPLLYALRLARYVGHRIGIQVYVTCDG